MHHTNLEIKYSALSIFEIRDNLDSAGKCILDEIEKLQEKPCIKPDTKKKTQTAETKQVHIAGSFFNRKSSITKSVSSKPPEKSDKNTFVVPEPNSQVNNIFYIFYIENVFVFIWLIFFIFSNLL